MIHMRNRFDTQLEQLQESMTQMGDKCLSSITDTIDALNTGNEKLAAAVISRTRTIRRDEREIENICLKLLMQQQPVASDLRKISASLKAVYDLERIGDVAADIAEIVAVEHVSTAVDILDMKEMANAARSMVYDSIKALNTKDAVLAQSVIDTDDICFLLFNDRHKLFIIRSRIKIAEAAADIFRCKITGQFLPFPQKVLVDIVCMTELV